MTEVRIRSLARTTMKWRPRNLEESLLPLLTLHALIGHGVFYFLLGKSKLCFSIIYSITVASAYLIALYYAIDKAWNANWLSNEDRTVIYVTFVNTVIWACAGIISWFNRKRYIHIVKKIAIIDNSLSQLGEPCDYNEFFWYGIRWVIACFLAVVASTIVDIFWMNEKTSVGETIFLSLVYHYPTHVNSIFIFNVATTIGIVRTRLARINNILERISSKPSDSDADISHSPWHHNSGCSGSSKRISVLSARNSYEVDKRLVQIVRHMHLELCDVPKEIERSYGVQIVLEMAANFMTLMGALYNIYWFLVKRSQPQWLTRMAMMIFWFAVYFIKLIFINVSCTRLVSEAQRTGEIIHDLRVPNDEIMFKDEISLFGMQMILNPVSIKPAGMFTLENRFITKFLATMITYLVIVIQMGGAPLDRGKNNTS